MKQKEKTTLLRQYVDIDGDNNIVGHGNTMVEHLHGNYYAIHIDDQRIETSLDELREILTPIHSTSHLVRISLIISIVILLGTGAVLSFLYRQNQRPRQMTGEFNVAVAEIAVVDQDGTLIRSEDGKALADFLAQRLETYFTEIDERTIRHEIWPPDYTGSITGKTPEDRARAAEALAQRINAHIVVYGVITYDGDHSQFTPEFFVNHKGFELAQEVIGAHEMGSAMLVSLPFEATTLQAVENPALASRVKALSLMTIGLAYYSIDDFEEALDYFEQAIDTEGWTSTAGKEVGYLLQGNAYVRLASDENTTMYLRHAEDSYRAALDANPDYTRANLGLSGVIYLESVGDPSTPLSETVDLDGLMEAEQMLMDILAMEGLPESINFEAKIHYSLGQIYLVRAQVLEGDWLEKAREQFIQVIQEYDMGNQQIVDLAGHAHAKVGLIELLEGHTDEAIKHHKAAIELVTPHYQAHYTTILGEIYQALGDKEKAISVYEQAIQIAEFYGNEESIQEYSQRLSEIEQESEQ